MRGLGLLSGPSLSPTPAQLAAAGLLDQLCPELNRVPGNTLGITSSWVNQDDPNNAWFNRTKLTIKAAQDAIVFLYKNQATLKQAAADAGQTGTGDGMSQILFKDFMGMTDSYQGQIKGSNYLAALDLINTLKTMCQEYENEKRKAIQAARDKASEAYQDSKASVNRTVAATSADIRDFINNLISDDDTPTTFVPPKRPAPVKTPKPVAQPRPKPAPKPRPSPNVPIGIGPTSTTPTTAPTTAPGGQGPSVYYCNGVYTTNVSDCAAAPATCPAPLVPCPNGPGCCAPATPTYQGPPTASGGSIVTTGTPAGGYPSGPATPPSVSYITCPDGSRVVAGTPCQIARPANPTPTASAVTYCYRSENVANAGQTTTRWRTDGSGFIQYQAADGSWQNTGTEAFVRTACQGVGCPTTCVKPTDSVIYPQPGPVVVTPPIQQPSTPSDYGIIGTVYAGGGDNQVQAPPDLGLTGLRDVETRDVNWMAYIVAAGFVYLMLRKGK